MWSFFATQIYVSPIYIWITANIEKWSFFAYPDLMIKIDEIEKIAWIFFHRVIFAFWIQICNPNLCKSHTFWNTANIGKWHIFTYPVLITKIDETENGRPPTCSVCNTAVTVEHILISCTKYKTKREVVFTDHYTNEVNRLWRAFYKNQIFLESMQ